MLHETEGEEKEVVKHFIIFSPFGVQSKYMIVV